MGNGDRMPSMSASATAQHNNDIGQQYATRVAPSARGAGPSHQVQTRGPPGLEADFIQTSDLKAGVAGRHAHDDKVVVVLEQRLAAVEGTLARVLGGISTILLEIIILKGCKPMGDGVDVRGKEETPVRHDAGKGSESKSASQSHPHSAVPHGASASHPLVVQDDADSGSGDNNDHDVPVRASGDGPAQRVHSNPRQ
jgi:hypothetical protein